MDSNMRTDQRNGWRAITSSGLDVDRFKGRIGKKAYWIDGHGDRGTYSTNDIGRLVFLHSHNEDYWEPIRSLALQMIPESELDYRWLFLAKYLEDRCGDEGWRSYQLDDMDIEILNLIGRF